MTSIPSALRALATRWPPEIISVSAAPFPDPALAAGVVVALTSGSPSRPRSPGDAGTRGNGLLSIEVVDRVLHVVGQVQGVVSDQALGELAVAALERFDDVDVVDDRALRPVVLADGP